MARTILLIAAEPDYEQLVSYCADIGLRLQPMMIGQSLRAPKDGPVCFLSLTASESLHPYGDPPIRLSVALDPMLLFMRPYHAPPFLVDGQISLNEDSPAISSQIRPHFEKIRRWVKKNWVKPHAAYVGPVAHELLSTGGATWRSCLDGVPLETIVVPQRNG